MDVLEKLLQLSKYDEKESKFVVDGFRHGFELGYEGPKERQYKAKNLQFDCRDKIDLWNKVMKEVKLGHFAGPFTEIPFENYIQSPIGLVPKSEPGETGLIFHFSYPEGDSVNSHIPKEKCSAKYKDLDHAIKLCLEIGKGCFVAKLDMKSAFRNLPIKPEDRKWLIMKAVSPIDNKVYYFVDKCLPFGASISCSHFQRVSNAINHIFEHRSKSKANDYLDDFLFAALLEWLCNQRVGIFLDICKEINFPVSMEKTEWATRFIIFLGMLLDTVNQTISIPVGKRDKALGLLEKNHQL